MISYQNRLLHIPLILLVFSLFFSGCRKAQDVDSFKADILAITYMTEYYAPFNYEQGGELYGVSVDILRSLFEKFGINPDNITIQMSDWAEAYQQTLDEANTMLFSMVRIPERENLFKWVGPIAPQKQILVTRKSSGVVIENDADMANYTIGVIEGYSDIQVLLDAGVPQNKLIEYPDPFTLYENLAEGNVQCIAYSDAGNNLMLVSLGLDPDDYEIAYIYKVLQLYYAFNINTAANIINYFEDKLEELKNDKTGDGSSVYEKILNKYNIIQHVQDNITEEMVTDLVNLTSSHIEASAEGTFEKINQGLAPYKDPVNPALYTFVYDTSVTIVAHATNPLLVGVNFKGKTDAAGKLFRDEIVQGALDNGTGWVDYIYTKPDESGLYYKTSYYKLTYGSDGVPYVVCAGRYK